MSSRTTALLLLIALCLCATVWWTERRDAVQVTSPSGAIASYQAIRPQDVQAIEIARDRVILRVERIQDGWKLVDPVQQPAQGGTVDAFLEELHRLRPEGYISASEIQASGELEKSFGLDQPSTLRLTLQGRAGKTILKLGARAPMGSRFFFQRLGDSGVFSAQQTLLDLIPETANEWRDPSLLGFQLPPFDRIEIHQKGHLAFEAVQRPGQGWQLRRPLSARADESRLLGLVQQLQRARVESFLQDSGPFDDPRFGLDPPRAECLLHQGTNLIVHLRFGSVPPDAPDLRHVLRVDRASLMQVQEDLLDAVMRPVNHYRDRRLLASLEGIDSIMLSDSNAGEGFAVARSDSQWHLLSPVSTRAHGPSVEAQLTQFARIEIVEFVNDVITDLSRYGFDRPLREYTLSRSTNVVARIQIGNPVPQQETLLYARRLDEPAVYAVPRSLLTQLAESHRQLRETAFTPAQVGSIRVVQQGQVREWVRDGGGAWTSPTHPDVVFLTEGVEETLHRWGQMSTERFVVTQPDVLRRTYRLDDVGFEVILGFKSGAPLRRLHLELGGSLGTRLAAFVRYDEDDVPIQMFVPTDIAELLLTQLGLP